MLCQMALGSGFRRRELRLATQSDSGWVLVLELQFRSVWELVLEEVVLSETVLRLVFLLDQALVSACKKMDRTIRNY